MRNFIFTEGFSFLNESRKKQLISILHRADALPIYIEGDDEVCLRAGYLKDGTLLAALFELGVDPIEKPRIFLKNKPKSINIMLPDGSLATVEFEECEKNTYLLNTRVETLYPTILLIKS